MPDNTLILLRHAKSDWSGLEADLDRPLNDRGRQQAPLVGRWLGHHVARIDLAVVSPAIRAQSTWSLTAGELDVTPSRVTDDRLYAASSMQLLAVVRELPSMAHTVVLVGHNPGIEDLVAVATGEWVHMNTSAVAVIRFEGVWATAGDMAASLTVFGRPPREIRH
ncbi:SixA phosphatase family protein [Cryobacterium psychrophilum]|uniref:Histidine phosphatase family protein n=1 Tax=Cryobacterium psychrophilum TaxID=41988 RepID=A0A4Y8KTF5_9MICO|nr:histidine phosphatase family protein [Cryobacterium psychrophilum]TDW28700.1 phosphohistidine phosphatase [Cryobacterium psychrophilum]TFD82359.1 histidine phosphatase family protein [Cryobacterium psychrophilum]